MVALFSVTLAIYLPTAGFEFLNWDDLDYVVNNENVSGGLSWTGLGWSFKTFYSGNWHPVTWVSHMLDCQFFGLKAGAHHLVNACIHSLNSALLFLVLLRLTGAFAGRAFAGPESSKSEKKPDSQLSTIGFGPALFVAALFALHPLRVESVAWISERKDLLSGLFFMLTLLTYSKHRSQFQLPSSRNSFLGFHRCWWYWLTLVFLALGLMSKPMLVTVPFVLLLLDFWPLQIWTFEKLAPLRSLVLEKVPLFVLVLASSVATFLAQNRGGAVASTDVISLVARLQNCAVSYVLYIRNLFWPADLLPIYSYHHHAPFAVGAAVMFLLGVTILVWLLRKSRPWLLFGWLWYIGMLVPVIGLVQVGSQSLADRYTYLPMIGLTVALTCEGVAWLGKVRAPKLAAVSIGSLILCSLAWATHVQLAYWRNTQTLFIRTLQLEPNNVQALCGLGTDLVNKGEIREGRSCLEKAIAIKPDFPEALGSLASLLDTLGDYDQAIADYRAVLQFSPNHDAALNNLAWLLATCPNPNLRNGDQAVRLATRACEVTHYTKPIYIGTLAAAYAQAGDFAQAVTMAEKAANLADSLNLPETAEKNRELIGLYRQGRGAAP